MTGLPLPLTLLGALLAGALVVPAPAGAQCRLCESPQTAREESESVRAIQLDVQARLDFDQVVLIDSASNGTATIKPDGSGFTSGALGALSGRTMVGSVIVRGEPGRLVRIELPGAIMLRGRLGGTLELGNLTSDLPGIPRLDSRGELRFRFGGELRIRGDADGDYRGDVPITVDYL